MIRNRMSLGRKLLELFWAFFCIGPSTLGGGYAMIPIIEREIVGKRGWLDSSEMNDILSLAGSAPGGVGVNAAAFIGYRIGGVLGAIAAVTGITLPTFGIVFMLSFVYGWLDEYPKVIAALKGIHAAVIGLILVAAYRLARTSLIDKTTAGVAVITLAVLLFANINPTLVIIAGLFIGIILVKAKEWLGVKVNTEKPLAYVRKTELVYPEYYI
ncbi:chromate transporter [Paenibacillus sp. LHD-38]|uniref:chromate transporter n=1 Tax=Paenibacillus sp. LHD-38 TaxID=3072143 RepID=UPI00280DFF3A|nr:chromate transporter [Paenibacillus sp. LHD-38]MDQ8736478.1 chromate transporter [Paenibacillus sp. LHD-38]